MQFVVTDEDGNISWSGDTDKAESFPSYDDAERRARALAELTPGHTMRIFELTGEVICPRGAVESRRIKPV